MNGMHRINGECDFCEEGTRYDYINFKCRSICGRYAHYEKARKSCVCNAGYHLINGYCQVCGKNEIYVERWGKCIIPCK